MRKLVAILCIQIFFGCNKSKQNSIKLDFDSSKVAEFSIVDSELTWAKVLEKKLSDYTSFEINELPELKRLTLIIIVPTFISKEDLANTMKYIVSEKCKEDEDIDEIVIFAYDDKDDLNNIGGYTFGRLFWGPKGEFGNVTPKIAKENLRDNYEIELDIKDKVGIIKKSDIPTRRELDIYNAIMSKENMEIEDDTLDKMVMKKFVIKDKEELDAIWLKVAAYKN